jgi:hypothetical protein
MSNPTVTVGSTIPVPADPSLVRNVFSLLQFTSQTFKNYKLAERATFSPSGAGDLFFMSVPLGDLLAAKPGFTTQEAWDKNDKNFMSVFVTPAETMNAVMPKIIIPSDALVSNGVDSSGGSSAWWAFDASYKDLFNWKILTVNGSAISASDYYQYAQVGGNFASQYVVSKKPDDTTANNVVVWELNNPANPPLGSWDETKLVGGGAFIMMLNVTPLNPSNVDPDQVQQKSWSVKIEFGDVTMTLNQTGALDVVLTGTGSSQDNQKANLISGQASQASPQKEQMNEKNPYWITVYPVWNGIVVTSGISDSPAALASTAQYIVKNRKASIRNSPYSTWFNPVSPADVAVTSPADVSVNFGTKVTLTATACGLDFSYVPCFYTTDASFDQFFIANDDIPNQISYDFDMYAIYTLNGTAYTLTKTISSTGVAGSAAQTHFEKCAWDMALAGGKFLRYAPQVFGSVLAVEETNQYPIKNGNGAFSLTWSGGTPGDPSPSASWQDYIQSISVTLSEDGSMGSIVVDKYGIAGQDAVAVQSIGAITIDATGGFGTVAGTIFKGLGMGIAENINSDGSSWTIPLVGLEKKLDDIALINIPYFDGKTISDAVIFLCKYAGITYDFTSAAGTTDKLGISEDLNVPRFDWKTGTTVKTALDQIMVEMGFRYLVIDGVVHLYDINTSGMPSTPGPDRNAGGTVYPNTKVITIDRTPDFEDLRNEVVSTAMRAVTDGENAQFDDIPVDPLLVAKSQTTTPDIPWSRAAFFAESGLMTLSELTTIVNKRLKLSKKYNISGKTTIPGNANIKPFDVWNGSYIGSVTHNLDFIGKSWTTDIELFTYG